MATENERWGHTRIVGALAKEGHQVSRSTARQILFEHGVGPAPEPLPYMPWSRFLKAHWEAIAAADFFIVRVWTAVGFVRYPAFFGVGAWLRVWLPDEDGMSPTRSPHG